MFEDSLLDYGGRMKTKKPATVIVSFVLQFVIIGVLVLIPLIYTEALPKAMLTTFLVAPAPPPPPPPPAAPAPTIVHHVTRIIQQGKMMAPSVIPKKVNIIKEEELPPDVASVGVVGGVPGGMPGGQAGGVLGGIIGGIGGAPPPPPKAAPQRVRVGGNVQQAKMVRMIQPTYPAIAKQAHIQGSVILHAIIAKDGTVQELQLMSGPPLLVKAAMDAVRQWRYQPTLLNGDPVEVDTTISVIFSLGG